MHTARAWLDSGKPAALLFTAEANFQFKQQTSSTSLPCAWLPPFQCGDPYIRVGENTVETILS